MSYILDALRRAQAERERGQVPGLHAQPGLGGAHRTRVGPAALQRPAWLWALVGAAVVALLLVPWVLMREGAGGAGGAGDADPGRALAAGVASPPAAPAPPPAVPTAAADLTPPLVVVSAAPGQKPFATGGAPAPKAAPTAPTGRSAVSNLPALPAAPSASPAAAAPGEAAAGVGQPPPAQVAATPAAPANPATAATPGSPVPKPGAAVAMAPAAAALPPVLTPEQRRDWPPLALGGSVWSDTPSARFVILAGQVVREGDSTPDGVLVERITPRAVVLRWRDQRGSLPF